MDLILRPANKYVTEKPWALQLRDHGPAETDYYTIAFVNDEVARAIIRAGACYWLFGDPDEKLRKEIEEKTKKLKNNSPKKTVDMDYVVMMYAVSIARYERANPEVGMGQTYEMMLNKALEELNISKDTIDYNQILLDFKKYCKFNDL